MDKTQIIRELKQIHEGMMGQAWGMLQGHSKTKRYPSDDLRNDLSDFRRTPQEHIKLSEESGLPVEWRISVLLHYWMTRVSLFVTELEQGPEKEIAERLLDYIREESLVMNEIGALSMELIRKKRGPLKGGAKRKTNADEIVYSELEAARRDKILKKNPDGYSICYKEWRNIVRRFRGSDVRDAQFYRDRERAEALLKAKFSLITKK